MKVQLWISYNTAVAAYVFIGNVCPTDVTLVLDLYELCVHNRPKDFQHVAHYFVSWNGLDQCDLVVSLEVAYLFFDLADDLEVVDAELELRVNVYLVGDLAEGVAHHKHITALERGF